MFDREKVIKGLEKISDYFFDIYRNDTDSYKCEKAQEYSDVAIDAISLLKEQEAILLENQHKPYGISTNANSPWISRCPRCGKKVEGKQTRFCKYCGQAVKWE